jgi:hypothetical protein
MTTPLFLTPNEIEKIFRVKIGNKHFGRDTDVIITELLQNWFPNNTFEKILNGIRIDYGAKDILFLENLRTIEIFMQIVFYIGFKDEKWSRDKYGEWLQEL